MSVRVLPIAGAALLVFGSVGCTNEERLADEQAALLAQQAGEMLVSLTAEAAEDVTGVVVRLAFGEEADLDLYVTDPLLDTVYFARHESRTGGRILGDVRCDTVGPRIEEVRFDAPWAGRYRVGVDHPARCDGARAPAPAAFAVKVDAGGETYQATGSVAVAQFELVVLEFEVQGPGVAQQHAAPQPRGQVLYERLCASCHGPQGLGDGSVADDTLLRPRAFTLNAFKFDTDADWERGTDADLANVIRHGPSEYGGSPLMPPWGSLSDEDIASLVAYIRELQR
jgi:mono/diheme cytochrome c family protein